MLTRILCLFILICSPQLQANKETSRAILTKLFGQTKDKIKIIGCPKFQLNPAEIFKSIKYKTIFNDKCDLQGEVALKLFSSFPIEMNVKSLNSFKAIQGTAQLNLGMETPPKILGELTKAKLIGRENIYFNAYYSGEILPATTLKVKPGTEKIKIEIYDEKFIKKIEDFSLSIK